MWGRDLRTAKELSLDNTFNLIKNAVPREIVARIKRFSWPIFGGYCPGLTQTLGTFPSLFSHPQRGEREGEYHVCGCSLIAKEEEDYDDEDSHLA